MKTITIAALFVAAIMTTSCKKEKPVNADLDNDIQILLLNESSANLLTPPSALSTQNIDIYYMKNGVKTLYYQENLGMPKGIQIFKAADGKERLMMFPVESGSEFSETLVKFGDLGTDTVRCQHYISAQSKRVIKVWVNGDLKWDVTTSPALREVTIIK